MENIKFKIKATKKDPYSYIGMSYRYKDNSEVRTIVKYDKEDSIFWTNRGTYLPFTDFLKHMIQGSIILENGEI